MMARRRRRIDQALRHAIARRTMPAGPRCDARSPRTVRGRHCDRHDVREARNACPAHASLRRRSARCLPATGRAHPAPAALRRDPDLAWHADVVRPDGAHVCPLARSRIHADPSVIRNPLGREEEGHLHGGAGWDHVRSRRPDEPERPASPSATNIVAGSELSLSTVTVQDRAFGGTGPPPAGAAAAGVGLGVGLGEAGGEYDGDTPTILIDSTICRTSDLTVSAGASSDNAAITRRTPSTSTIQATLSDPPPRCRAGSGCQRNSRTARRPPCTLGTPLDSHRACRFGSPRCRCSAAPRDSSRDRRSWARGSVRSCRAAIPGVPDDRDIKAGVPVRSPQGPPTVQS